jgi:hypothetical protein
VQSVSDPLSPRERDRVRGRVPNKLPHPDPCMLSGRVISRWCDEKKKFFLTPEGVRKKIAQSV